MPNLHGLVKFDRVLNGVNICVLSEEKQIIVVL